MAVGRKILEPDEIQKTIQTLKGYEELFETRFLEVNGKRVSSGYLRDVEIILDQLSRLNSSDSNVYMTLNSIKSECYSKAQRDKFIQIVQGETPITSDTDIVGYERLFIDVDPKRPSGVSSIDEQLSQAKIVGDKVYVFMKDLGFNEPITAMSGNGIHLLYGIRLRDSDEDKALIKSCLLVLDMLFSNDCVDIDKTNFNPARICKLYGTVARRGSDTAENPRRMSRLLSEGSKEPTGKAYLEKLAVMLPVPEKPQKYNGYHPNESDLEEWLIKYELRYQKTNYLDGIKHILEQCPFDDNHKGKDARIFQARSGAIGFHCFHNSCSDKTWKDVGLLYKPEAYEKRQKEYEARIYSRQ